MDPSDIKNFLNALTAQMNATTELAKKLIEICTKIEGRQELASSSRINSEEPAPKKPKICEPTLQTGSQVQHDELSGNVSSESVDRNVATTSDNKVTSQSSAALENVSSAPCENLVNQVGHGTNNETSDNAPGYDTGLISVVGQKSSYNKRYGVERGLRF